MSSDAPRAAAYGHLISGAPPTPWLALSGADHLPALEVAGLDSPLDSLIHPRLAYYVQQTSLGDRTVVLHGGAVMGVGGAWIVVGARMAGKSSLLWAAHGRGRLVLADDVSMIADGELMSGPRCLDLREPVEGTVPVRGDRHRLTLPSAAARVPVAGFVHLGWEPSLERPRARPLGLAERLALLVEPGRGYASPNQAGLFLDLVALPAYALERSRGDLAASADVFCDAIGCP